MPSSELNDFQKQAIVDDNPVCLVNAQVGSGKTTVLISKIIYLHSVMNVPLNEMVVLTFTNKAANEIRERMLSSGIQFDEDDLRYFGTFHSVALRMLKTILPVREFGYTIDFTVIDPEEEIDLANYLIDQQWMDIKYRNKLSSRLEKASRGQYKYSRMKADDDIKEIVEVLRDRMVKQNKMNFDDLIVNATLLLYLEAYHPGWIIIDEFQDIDDIQFEFVKAMLGDNTKLFAVGDPNQIIYSWRGSNKSIFSTFKDEFGAIEYSLPINYRSSDDILEVAKCFLPKDSQLEGSRGEGSRIVIKNHYNPFNEAEYLVDNIIEAVKDGLDYKDIGIFYRLNRQSNTLEDVLSKQGIPYNVSQHKSLKDSPVLNWVIKILRSSVNSADKLSAASVLSDSTYGDRVTYKQAVSALEVISRIEFQETPFLDLNDLQKLIDESCAGNNLNDIPFTLKKLKLLESMSKFEKNCLEFQQFSEAYGYLNIDEHIFPSSADFLENKASILALFAKIEEYAQNQHVDLLTAVREFTNSSTLYSTEIMSEDLDMQNNSVKLMTLHSAKGLEFKHVYIIGVNPGFIPLRLSIEDDEEERRLFYVGITRAMNFLEISYYTDPGDSQVLPGPSKFLSEIPRSLVDWDLSKQAKSDLHHLRREILENRTNRGLDQTVDHVEKVNKVSHPKYGVGIITSETADTISVSFQGYGQKDFLKNLSNLTFID